jgi:hypothetical protein
MKLGRYNFAFYRAVNPDIHITSFPPSLKFPHPSVMWSPFCNSACSNTLQQQYVCNRFQKKKSLSKTNWRTRARNPFLRRWLENSQPFKEHGIAQSHSVACSLKQSYPVHFHILKQSRPVQLHIMKQSYPVKLHIPK